MDHRQIAEICSILSAKRTHGELGQAIAGIIQSYPPRDMQQLCRNFARRIRNFAPEYRDMLDKAIAGHLYGTFQALRRMHELRAFDHMNEPLALNASGYWTMVVAQCSSENEEEDWLRFLTFLLEGFCMLVQGSRPSGRDAVSRRRPGGGHRRDALLSGPGEGEHIDSALCPFCPAAQTPGIGLLKPPVRGSDY